MFTVFNVFSDLIYVKEKKMLDMGEVRMVF